MATLRRPTRVLLVILLVAALGLVSSTLFSSPLQAQGRGSLELVAQSAWVDDGGIYDIQVRVAGADPDSSVVLRAYPPWPDRGTFLRLDLQDQDPVLELEPVPLGELQGTSNEVLPLQLGIVGPNTNIDESEDDERELCERLRLWATGLEWGGKK